MMNHVNPQSKPLILAHRGLVTHYQENTLEAVQASLDSPHCDGSEFDVFLTKDNKVVLFHDENMERLTGINREIYDMTWDDLKTIQIQSTLKVDGGIREYQKPLAIPLLSDVLEEIKGKDCFVNIEMKAYAAKWKRRKVGRAVAEVLRKMDLMNQVVCTSFNFFMLYDLEKTHRATPSGFAYDDNMPLSGNHLNKLMEWNIVGKLVHSNVVCSEYTLIDEDTISKYHSKNMRVGSFTLYPLEVSSDQIPMYDKEVKRLARLGVDWIETDRPELAYKQLYSDL